MKSREITNLEIRKALAVELFELPSVEIDGTGVRYCPTADLQHLRVKPYESTGDGMLMVIEAMRAKGFRVNTKNNAEDLYRVLFGFAHSFKTHYWGWGEDESFPLAVAKAALAALAELRSQK